MPPTRRFSAAEESMAQFIGPLDLSCLQSARPSAVVDPVKRKLPAAIDCPRAMSFTPLDRFGAVESVASLRHWRTVIGVSCRLRLKTESRRLTFRPSGAGNTALRVRKL